MTSRTVQVNVIGDSSKLEAALDKAGSKGESAAGRLHSAFSKAFGGLGLSNLTSGVDGAMSGVEKMAGGLGSLIPVAGGVAAASVGIGVAAVKAADDYDRAHVALVQAVTDAGRSFDAYKGQIGSVDQAMERFGFNNQQTEEALSHFVTAVQDPAKALSQMGLAADIARARNIDLTSATDLLAKANAGNLRALKQMGIDLPIQASNALKVQQAQDAVAKAQAEVNRLTALGVTGSQQHERALIAQQKAQLAVQTVEHQIEVARQNGTSPAVLAQLQQRLAIAQQQLAVATAQAQAPTAGLAGAQDRLRAAQSKLNDEQKAAPAIIDALTQRFGGQAAAAADTFGGKMQTASARVHDLSIKLGQDLEPALANTLDFLVNDFIPRFESGWKRLMDDMSTGIGDIEQWITDVMNLGSGDQGIQNAVKNLKPGQNLTNLDTGQGKPAVMTAVPGNSGRRGGPPVAPAPVAGPPPGVMPGTFQADDPMTLKLLQQGKTLQRVVGSNGQVVVNLHVQTNADPNVIAQEVAWALAHAPAAP